MVCEGRREGPVVNYSRKWRCRICHARQESIDTPTTVVCDDCLRPVAVALCRRALGVGMDQVGVDVGYWMGEAEQVVAPMMRRWARDKDSS